MCLFRLQDLEGAKKELSRYLELDPDGEHTPVAKAVLDHIDKK